MNHHFCILTGVYALRPELPAIPGGEGVGVVTAVGSHVTSLKTGDWVIPALPSLGEYLYIVTIVLSSASLVTGLWRTRVVGNGWNFMRVCSDMAVETAATLSVNPTTAYRMLTDYVTIEKGQIPLTLNLRINPSISSIPHLPMAC